MPGMGVPGTGVPGVVESKLIDLGEGTCIGLVGGGDALIVFPSFPNETLALGVVTVEQTSGRILFWLSRPSDDEPRVVLSLLRLMLA